MIIEKDIPCICFLVRGDDDVDDDDDDDDDVDDDDDDDANYVL